MHVDSAASQIQHGRSYRPKSDEERNYRLFLQNEADGIIVTPYGLSLHR